MVTAAPVSRRIDAVGWTNVKVGPKLVRTFAQGTWVQVLPLYDEDLRRVR